MYDTKCIHSSVQRFKGTFQQRQQTPTSPGCCPIPTFLAHFPGIITQQAAKMAQEQLTAKQRREAEGAEAEVKKSQLQPMLTAEYRS